jgi:hypothetical protein
VPVPQDQERPPSAIADRVRPALDHDPLSGMLDPELAAGMGTPLDHVVLRSGAPYLGGPIQSRLALGPSPAAGETSA